MKFEKGVQEKSEYLSGVSLKKKCFIMQNEWQTLKLAILLMID